MTGGSLEGGVTHPYDTCNGGLTSCLHCSGSYFHRKSVSTDTATWICIAQSARRQYLLTATVFDFTLVQYKVRGAKS